MKELRAFMLPLFLLTLPVGCKPASAEILPSIIPWKETRAPTAPDVALADAEPDGDGVEFLGIDFGADGTFIIVSFRAPYRVAQGWQQGSIYVIDEATGDVYKDIPVMPVVGPLFGKPQEEGQIGYVMFTNLNFGIKSGSVVTVVLGNFKRTHVKVP